MVITRGIKGKIVHVITLIFCPEVLDPYWILKDHVIFGSCFINFEVCAKRVFVIHKRFDHL